MKETKLGFLYPESTDEPDGPTQLKQIAEKANDLALAGGNNLQKFVSATTLTRKSTSYGSLSTPIKVTLPYVKEGQIIEIWFATGIKADVIEGGSGGNGRYVIGAAEMPAVELTLEANVEKVLLTTGNTAGLLITPGAMPKLESGAFITGNFGAFQWQKTLSPGNTTNLSVEFQVKAKTAGTVSATNAILLARSIG